MELSKLEPKSDSRGTFIETYKLPNDGQVSTLVIRPDERRGEHYHLRKTETFVVMYGSAKMAVKDRETDNVMNVSLSGTNPMSVKVIPNHTHYIEATDEGCIVMIWCDEQFDENDPDTYKEEL